MTSRRLLIRSIRLEGALQRSRAFDRKVAQLNTAGGLLRCGISTRLMTGSGQNR
jgi:hypothetical protein